MSPPKPRTALIVEDEIFVALDLERILLDAGYTVRAIAADRPAAMAAMAGGGCDMAFVDVNLRDGATGPDIASTLARQYGVKVVFVTANPAQISGPVEALGYVRKPFSDSSILAAAELAEGRIAHSDAVTPLLAA